MRWAQLYRRSHDCPKPYPAVPQAAVVTFTANGPVETTLTISTGEREWQLTYDVSKDPAGGLPVIGLYPGVEHDVAVTIRDEGGAETTAAPLKFTAPAVPDGKGEFPPIEVTITRANSLSPVLSYSTRAAACPVARISNSVPASACS